MPCRRSRPRSCCFPNWFWFNIYEISSWSRAILIPLSICYAKKPFRKIAPEQGIDELFPNGRLRSQLRLKWDDKLISWRNFFLVLDRMTHMFERVHVRPLRWLALKKAEKWMLAAPRDERRLGRDLPGNSQLDHRLALPGILAGRSAGDSRHR